MDINQAILKMRSLPVEQQKSILAQMSDEQKQRVFQILGEQKKVAQQPTQATPKSGGGIMGTLNQLGAMTDIASQKVTGLRDMEDAKKLAAIGGGLAATIATEGKAFPLLAEALGGGAMAGFGAGALSGAGSSLVGNTVGNLIRGDDLGEGALPSSVVGGVVGAPLGALTRGLAGSVNASNALNSTEAGLAEGSKLATDFVSKSRDGLKNILNATVKEFKSMKEPLIKVRKQLLPNLKKESLAPKALEELRNEFTILKDELSSLPNIAEIEKNLFKANPTQFDLIQVQKFVEGAAESNTVGDVVSFTVKNSGKSGAGFNNLINKHINSSWLKNEEKFTDVYREVADKLDGRDTFVRNILETAENQGVDSVLDDSAGQLFSSVKFQKFIGKLANQNKIKLDDIKSAYFTEVTKSTKGIDSFTPTASVDIAEGIIGSGKSVDEGLRAFSNKTVPTSVSQPATIGTTTVRNPKDFTKFTTTEAQDTLKRLGGNQGNDLASLFDKEAVKINRATALAKTARRRSDNLNNVLDLKNDSKFNLSDLLITRDPATNLRNFQGINKLRPVAGIGAKEILNSIFSGVQ